MRTIAKIISDDMAIEQIEIQLRKEPIFRSGYLKTINFKNSCIWFLQTMTVNEVVNEFLRMNGIAPSRIVFVR